MHSMNTSVENYLETIYRLQIENEKVYSIDIARFLDVSRPSVSNAMKKLGNQGYINMDRSGVINFTEEGSKKAKQIYEKHLWFKELLEKAGVEKDIAEIEACKVEHAISYPVFEKLKAYIEKRD
ncbi:MAG: metal-dependent transcriptional regulator [Tissierellia bacterium]|nr:metal-dependent transcriptional regulator [Tissierellia bacterium]